GDGGGRLPPRLGAQGRLAGRVPGGDGRTRAAARSGPGGDAAVHGGVGGLGRRGGRPLRPQPAAVVGTLDMAIVRELKDKEGNALPEVVAAHGVDLDDLDAARTRIADAKA